MQLFNADGSRSEVSGNGVRCLAAWIASTQSLEDGAFVDIETDAGLKSLELLDRRDGRYTFCAAMGEPEQIEQQVLDVGGEARDGGHAARRESAVRRARRGDRRAAAHDRPGVGGSSALSRGHQRRARHRRGAGSRQDPDLGAGCRAHRGLGHWRVRGGRRGDPIRQARRATCRSSRRAARSASSGTMMGCF